MADVDDLGLGRDVQDGTLDRPHKMVVQAEVGSQSDDGAVSQLDLMELEVWIDLKVMVL